MPPIVVTRTSCMWERSVTGECRSLLCIHRFSRARERLISAVSLNSKPTFQDFASKSKRIVFLIWPPQNIGLEHVSSPGSQRAYRFAIDDFVVWYCTESRLAFNKTVGQRISFG